MAADLHDSLFRAYDIRGIYQDTLDEAAFRAIGQAFATVAHEQSGKDAPRIAVARDGRLSSTSLADALMEGLMAGGADVHYCGLGPTPMLYYAVCEGNLDGGMMVTGSHNPPQHNGVKMMLGKASFFGDDIQALAQRIKQGDVRSAEGTRRDTPQQEAYVTMLANTITAKGLKLVWDAGNGASGEVVEALCTRDTANTHHTLYTDIDGTFPNHHPDPSVPENLSDIMREVANAHYDIGLAFDGDGDRLGVVDDKGRILSPDHLLMLFARDVLSRKAGAHIIADVKTSGLFFEDVKAHGGTAEMYKTGHSHIKTRMKQTGAAFAGEASGHIFFADDYFGFDDGIYAAIRLINLVSASGKKLSRLVDALPEGINSPEYRIPVEEERKFAIVEAVRADLQAKGADMVTLDGMRVNTPDGWWLLRASNTQAVLNARCEGVSEAGLNALISQLRETLAAHGVTLPQ